MATKFISPIKDTGKRLTVDLSYNVLNDDWLHASRLVAKARKGDKKAKEELERMDNDLMIIVTE